MKWSFAGRVSVEFGVVCPSKRVAAAVRLLLRAEFLSLVLLCFVLTESGKRAPSDFNLPSVVRYRWAGSYIPHCPFLGIISSILSL